MPQNLANEKSTLLQVMAWCHQAASHYLNQGLSHHMVSLVHNESKKMHQKMLSAKCRPFYSCLVCSRTSSLNYIRNLIAHLVIRNQAHQKPILVDSLTVSLNSPQRQAVCLPLGLCKGLSVTSVKRWELPTVMLAHDVLQFTQNALQLFC